MDIFETTVKSMFFVAAALVALVIVDARWFGPRRSARRRAKMEQGER